MPLVVEAKTSYFVWDRSWALHPARLPAHYPEHPGIYWFAGRRFAHPIPEPVEITLKPFDPADQGPELAEYIKGTIPLFREDLIAALRQAGVNNLDLYQAALIDPDDGRRHQTHRAVNIVGLQAAADLHQSTAETHGAPVVDVSFDKLVLDESKTGGLRMFRLAESPTTIIVHRSVRDHLRAKGFDKLWFIKPEKAAIL